MAVKFTILEKNLLESSEYQSLTPRARVLFIDVVSIGKAANGMGLFDAKKARAFRFHPHMANGPIDRGQFYEHLRTFEEVGLLDIVRADRRGLAQDLFFNGKYAEVLRPAVCEIGRSGLGPPLGVASGHHLLKDSTLETTSVNATFHIGTGVGNEVKRIADVSGGARSRDEELAQDLAGIPNRIWQFYAGRGVSKEEILRMAAGLRKRAWADYRRRHDNARRGRMDVAGALEDLTKGIGSGFVPSSGEWKKPLVSVKKRIVEDVVKATGDVRSLDNWWLLVHRMSRSEQGFLALQSIVYDFVDELARKDPRATAPDRPGAVLNGLLRAKCGEYGIDLGPRA